jgi:hypothetical protein
MKESRKVGFSRAPVPGSELHPAVADQEIIQLHGTPWIVCGADAIPRRISTDGVDWQHGVQSAISIHRLFLSQLRKAHRPAALMPSIFTRNALAPQ